MSTPDEPEAAAGRRTAEDVPLPGGHFQLFVQKLGFQALISLGVLENPLTRKRRVDLGQARAVLDDLAMLQAKTAGNLDPEEAEHLGKVVRDLQAHFERLAGARPGEAT